VGKVHINETSSYVDLAPLYGNDEETLKDIRVIDGRGRLKPDCFAESRLLLLPPAVCVLLVMFNRNHNVCSWSFDVLSLLTGSS
jgi:linoleate 10R-lipoxygenase